MIFRIYNKFITSINDKKWQSNQRKMTSIIAIARIILVPTVGFHQNTESQVALASINTWEGSSTREFRV